MALVADQIPKIQKYEVLDEIGHGGMATVDRARDRRLARDVAIKVIHKHLRENKEVALRFVSEARAVAKLKHPNIVEVYDVSEEDDAERYLVVELVPGTTLRELLADRGHMPTEVAAAVGIEIGTALEHAHRQGVIHRDVKPENVLVDLSDRTPSKRGASQERPADAEAGRVKITDFGIAKLLDAQGVTSTGQVLGSPAHMAPEQIEGGDVTARADVFGLGVLLYECMVGRLPFDGKNPAQVLRKVLDGTFTPPERARPTVGAGFSKIVERALCREPEGRYESCEELCDALRTELTALGFDNPRRELVEYLLSAESYTEAYERRIVTRLVDLGKTARSAKQAPTAAAHFNRALAFRPDDAELLRQVAGLARSERRRRVGLRVGALLGMSVVLGAGAYGVSRRVQTPVLGKEPDAPVQPSAQPVLAPVPSLPTTVVGPTPSAARTAKLPVMGPLPSAAPAGKTRTVRFVVRGAQLGIVRVDGTPHADWFGKGFELAVGAHTLEVVPPNSDCCINKGVQSFEVKPGDTDLTITGEAPFKDATVSVVGPEDTYVTCPDIFSDRLRVGRALSVKIPGPSSFVKGQCTFYRPDADPKEKPVKLEAGKSTQLYW
ncbi:MAG: serine/threonine protein kinase [Polyangiaceae bacterium]|nr:serine/threonine protein kinase [Polyangiaceae bacterium]